MREPKKSRIYLPRSTMEMDAIITIERIGEVLGISFGKTLEKLLHESPTFREAYIEVSNKMGDIDVSKLSIRQDAV